VPAIHAVEIWCISHGFNVDLTACEE